MLMLVLVLVLEAMAPLVSTPMFPFGDDACDGRAEDGQGQEGRDTGVEVESVVHGSSLGCWNGIDRPPGRQGAFFGPLFN
jgi:hypothetical protein